MKNKHSITFSLLASFMLVAGLVMPASLGNPAPAQAAPGMLKWSTVDTPGSFSDRSDIVLRSEIDKLVVGPTGTTLLAIVTRTTVPAMQLYSSSSSGRSWGGSSHLRDAMLKEWGAFTNVWDAAIAPDDQKFWAVVSSSPTTNGPVEVWVTQDGGTTWENTNLGLAADFISCIDISMLCAGERDILVGTRDGTGLGTAKLWVRNSTPFSPWRDQTGPAGDPGNTWANPGGDVVAAKFSSTYVSDGSIVAIYSAAPAANAGTLLTYGIHDLGANTTTWGTPVPISDPTTGAISANAAQIITADLEIPSDFSGQAASLRRAYVSLDSGGVAGLESGIYRVDDTTIYELMDTTNLTNKRISSIAYFGSYASGKLLAGEVFGDPCKATVPTWFTDSPTTCPIPCWYEALKPTTGAAGLCDNGYGNAQVDWSPNGNLAFVGTGSACLGPFNIPNNTINCAVLREWPDGYLNWVAWDESAFGISRNNGETWNQLGLIDTTISQFTDVAPTPDCKTIYLSSVNTGGGGSTSRCTASYSVLCDNNTTPPTCTVEFLGAICACATLTQPTVNYDVVAAYDPNACGCNYSISGNFTYACDCAPGCTRVTPFTTTTGLVKCGSTATVTVSADCQCSACPGCTTTITEGCHGFDSVWRSSSNPTVESPLSAMPVGTYWERIFTHVTALDCTQTQSNVALLRLVPWCADPTGEIVGWAAMNTTTAFWSPDYGDYWAPITVRNAIQDFTFESRTMLYFLEPHGVVQKMPFTGTAWSTSLPNYSSGISPAHTIAAMPEGKVIVGHGEGAPYAASISLNMDADNPKFSIQTTAGPLVGGAVHVTFDPKFDDNSIYYLSEEKATGGTFGSVYRNNPTAQLGWADTDLMAATNGAVGCPNPDTNRLGFSGIVLAYTGEALYASSQVAGAGVWRTIDDGTGKYGPLSSMPKPGIAWDELNVGLSADVVFTAQPTALKACGCCTLTTDTTLYAIDNRAYDPDDRTGMLWEYTDCLAKRGPSLITEDKALIGCDPVSGRAQEVNFCWEQLCLADQYDIEIAKDKDFTILVIDRTTEGACGGFTPADVTKPCAYFPAGGRASGASELALWGNLECGHTYYWRVKARHGATGQDIRSPWSDARSFNVKAGLPVVASYNGLQLLAPANGMIGLPVKSPFFSWTPLGENTKYKFTLAKDGNLTQIIKEAEVTGTAYSYDGTLDYSTSYFWRVMALAPAPSDWSATFNFRTEAAPAAKTPSGTPTTGLWNQLALPMKAIGNWLASLNLQPIPALALLPWGGWVLIALCIILFILWLVVMIAISKPLRK